MADVRVKLGYDYNSYGAEAFLKDSKAMQEAVGALRKGGTVAPGTASEEDKNWLKVKQQLAVEEAKANRQAEESTNPLIQRRITLYENLEDAAKKAKSAEGALATGGQPTTEGRVALDIQSEWQTKAWQERARMMTSIHAEALEENKNRDKLALEDQVEMNKSALRQEQELVKANAEYKAAAVKASTQAQREYYNEVVKLPSALTRVIDAERERARITELAQQGYQKIFAGAGGLSEGEQAAVTLRNQQALTGFVKEQGRAFEDLQKVKKQDEESWRNLSRAMFGITILGFSLQNAMRMIEVAFGEKLPPAVRSATDALMFASGVGASLAMTGMPATVVAVGTLAASVFGLGVNFMATSQEAQNLSKQLDSFAKKDELQQTLATQLQLTKEEGVALYDLSQKYPALAKATKDYVEAANKSGVQQLAEDLATSFVGLGSGIMNSVEAFLTWQAALGGAPMGTFKEAFGFIGQTALRGSKTATGADEDVAKKRADFLMKLDGAVGDAETKSHDANQKEFQKNASERGAAWASMLKGQMQASAQYADNKIRLDRETAKAYDDWNFQQGQKMQGRLDEDLRNQRTADDDAARMREQRDNRMADISRNYQQREADDLWDYQHRVIDSNRERIRAQQDLTADLLRISRKLYEDLADLDFNTGQQMRNAKTERDRENIMYDALYARSKLFRSASDSRADRLSQAERDSQAREEKRRNDEEDYRHRREIAMRERADQESDARRSYEQDKAWADKRNRDQADDLVKRRKAEDEAAQRQYDDIGKRYTQSLQDLKDNLGKQLQSYRDTYDEVDKRIRASLAIFLDAERTKLDVVRDNAAATRRALGEEIGPPAQPTGERPKPAGFQEFAMGGTVPGPVGKPRWVLAHGGEEISPTPGTAGVKSASPQYVSISVEPVLGPAMAQMMAQLMRSNAFREGVRVLINDEVVRG